MRALQRSSGDDDARRMASAFAAKVAPSTQPASARALADARADLIGAGAVGCSRRTIGRARDALREVVKDF